MAVTWNDANNTIAQTANVIITVRDTLTGLGIEVSNVCDAESVTEAVTELWNKWLKEVERSIDSITFEMLGNFLTTLAALLAQILASAATAYVNLFLLEILAGNIINSIVSAVVFALALIPGAELVLQYYLVSSLRRDLQRRRELGWILQRNVSQLINLFDSFYNLFKFEEDLLYTDLRKALKNIRKAEAIVGKEASKNFYGNEPVTIDNINTADNYVAKAINNLTHENYDVVANYIRQVNSQYGITADVPQGFDIPGWIKYFETLQPLVALNFFTYEHNPGDPGYENEVKQKNNRYYQFISAIMQVMPPILQRIVLNATFKDASNVIFERVPVWANNVKLLKDIKKYIDNTLSVSEKFLNDYLNVNRTPPMPEPSLFKNPATKDITWRNITSKIRIEEAGVLLFPSYWDYIKNVGGLLQNILLPILNILKSVDIEIDGVLTGEERPGVAELSVKQFKWIEELTVARGLFSTLINSTSSYGGWKLNPIQVYNATVQAELRMNDLKSFIKNKTYDFKTNTPKTQPADVVYETAQRYLGNLALNMYIIVNPAAAKNTITGLQSIRVALSEQIKLDLQEIKLCSAFITTVESNPVFQAAKPYLDKLLDDLAQTPIGSGIANQILTGDISGVIGILEGYWATNDIINLVNCENQHTEQTVDPSILGINPEIEVESAKHVQEVTETLNSSMQMITDKIPFITNMINELVPQA